MSEIKFRAWDSKNNKIYKVTNVFDISGTGVNARRIQVMGNPDLMTKKRATLMQYTGLKDKNGVDIYEGDICQDTLNEKWQGKIYFDKGCFWFGWENIIEPIDEVAESLEVIGNVYENKDLLK